MQFTDQNKWLYLSCNSLSEQPYNRIRIDLRGSCIPNSSPCNAFLSYLCSLINDRSCICPSAKQSYSESAYNMGNALWTGLRGYERGNSKRQVKDAMYSADTFRCTLFVLSAHFFCLTRRHLGATCTIELFAPVFVRIRTSSSRFVRFRTGSEPIQYGYPFIGSFTSHVNYVHQQA